MEMYRRDDGGFEPHTACSAESAGTASFESDHNAGFADDGSQTDELRQVSVPITSRRELRDDYGVDIIVGRFGERSFYSVLWDKAPLFVTTDRITTELLRSHGICRTSDLTGGRYSTNCNYVAYLKNRYGIHVMSIFSPEGPEWAIYQPNNELISHVKNLTELQHSVENANLERKQTAPPDGISITAMPDGKISLTFPDSSEVLLDKHDDVVSWRTSEGREFRRIPGGMQCGAEIMRGKAEYKRGLFSFTFHQAGSRCSLRAHGDGPVEVELRAGTGASVEPAIVTYEYQRPDWNSPSLSL
jgi:hypothetical protein